jgi:hypothetical protein
MNDDDPIFIEIPSSMNPHPDQDSDHVCFQECIEFLFAKGDFNLGIYQSSPEYLDPAYLPQSLIYQEIYSRLLFFQIAKIEALLA